MDYKKEFNKSKLSEEEKLLIYGVYAKLIEGIKHFDGIQTTYRMMSSTLLLAIVAAIGFLFSRMATEFPVNRLIGVIAVCVSGIAGITTLGFLDLVFQERLVVSNFVEALKFEKTYKWLPQVHHRMVHGGTHHGSPTRKALFYIGCSTCLFIIAGSALVDLSHAQSYVKYVVWLAVLVIILLYSLIFTAKTGKFERIVEQLFNEEKKRNGRLRSSRSRR